MAVSVKYSAKALITDQRHPDLILLIREQLSDGRVVYDLPGGRIEPGETPQKTIARELQEELCISTSIGEEIGTYTFTMSAAPFRRVICRTFLCRGDQHQPIDVTQNPAENEHILGADWMSLQKILSEKPAGIGPSLMLLLKKLVQ